MIAGVLELADEVDSKSIASNGVRVQVPPPALEVNSPQLPDISGSCGLFLFYGKEHPIEYPFWEDRPAPEEKMLPEAARRRRRKCGASPGEQSFRSAEEIYRVYRKQLSADAELGAVFNRSHKILAGLSVPP